MLKEGVAYYSAALIKARELHMKLWKDIPDYELGD